jgi:hypothetical protein
MFKIVFDPWNDEACLVNNRKHSVSYYISKKINKILKQIFCLNESKPLIDLNILIIAEEIEKDPKTIRRYIKQSEYRGHLIRTKKEHKKCQVKVNNFLSLNEEILSEVFTEHAEKLLKECVNKINKDLKKLKKHKNKNL